MFKSDSLSSGDSGETVFGRTVRSMGCSCSGAGAATGTGGRNQRSRHEEVSVKPWNPGSHWWGNRLVGASGVANGTFPGNTF